MTDETAAAASRGLGRSPDEARTNADAASLTCVRPREGDCKSPPGRKDSLNAMAVAPSRVGAGSRTTPAARTVAPMSLLASSVASRHRVGGARLDPEPDGERMRTVQPPSADAVAELERHLAKWLADVSMNEIRSV